MNSSLAYHLYFDKKSAEIYIGGPVKSLGRKKWFKLSDLHILETKNLKTGVHDNAWFNSPEAAHEPVVTQSDDDLFVLLLHILKKAPVQSIIDTMRETFFGILHERDSVIESTDRTVGTLIETLRTFNKVYPEWMDDLYIAIDKLSKLRFFKLWK
jgi:hypothetical protein